MFYGDLYVLIKYLTQKLHINKINFNTVSQVQNQNNCAIFSAQDITAVLSVILMVN